MRWLDVAYERVERLMSGIRVRSPLLVPPVLIEEQAEALWLSLLECFSDPVAKLLCMMKALDDRRVALLRVPLLVTEDVAATPDDPGVEQQDVAAELFDRRGGDV